MKETHPGSTGHTQDELIEGERAQASAVQKCFSEMQRKERKRKGSTKMMARMRMTIHNTHPRTTMMTAKLTPSSIPSKGSSRKLTRRATHK